MATIAEGAIKMKMTKLLLDVFRPKRWYRNLAMIIGSLIAIKILNLPASHIFSVSHLLQWLAAFVSLCLVASANYGINEVLDAKTDAKHPQKKYRAIPSGKVSAKLVIDISLVLYACGLGLIALTGNYMLFLSVFLLLVSGIIYNVPPIRLKDRAYADFTTEALNNAIRLMVGWYAISSSSDLVPVSFLLAYWFVGVFLMAAKRFGEIRLFGDNKKAAGYRRSLKFYTQEKLLMSMVAGISASSFMLGFLSCKYSVDVVVILPFVIVWIFWFFRLSFEENTIVKDPERIFEKKKFLTYSLLVMSMLGYLFYSGDQIFGWIKQ